MKLYLLTATAVALLLLIFCLSDAVAEAARGRGRSGTLLYAQVDRSLRPDRLLGFGLYEQRDADAGMHASLLKARGAVSSSAKNPIPASQRSALRELYESLGGPSWEYGNTARLGREWDVYNSSSDPCIDEWYGIGCSCNGRAEDYKFDDNDPFQYYSYVDINSTNTLPCNVTLLVLKHINLDGQIPSSIGSISSLHQLLLSGYSIYGELPSSIGNLIALEYLAIISTSVSGAVPESIGGLGRLIYLSLDDSKFLSLPDTLGNLSSLQKLYAYNNCLVDLPDSIGKLPNLEVLDLYTNYLEVIPKTLCNITTLQFLGLGSNKLTSIPESIGNLNLTVLYLYNNKLGKIPDSIGAISSLRLLNLGYNLLEVIPDSIANLDNLRALNLGNNYLVATPTFINYLRNLEYLVLSNLSLEVVPDLTGLTSLKFIYVNNNRLTSIPFMRLENISDLDLGNNRIHSTLDFIKEMTNVKSLYINNNFFMGTIPDELYDKDLMFFAADSNLLTGTISSRFSTSFKYLVYWNVQHNSLSGALPSLKSSYIANAKFISFANNSFTGSLSDFNCSSAGSNLYFVDLHDNSLSGELGTSIFNCSSLWYLDLCENSFSGHVPDKFDMVPELQYLYLDNNSFSGPFPASLSACSQLEELWLNGNELTGPVPYLKNLTKLSQLFLQGNDFNGYVNFIDPRSNSLLSIVDISNNNFQGHLDLELFVSPTVSSLLSFAASENCLTTRLSPAICNSSSLQTLILDGIHTSKSCRRSVLLHIVDHAYISAQSISDVPDCLFGISSLKTLHLSGNGITGSLPADIQLSSSLEELILSHNDYKGAIPDTVQRHPWRHLDLSYNKISGTLLPALNASMHLTLSVNRLSGAVPLSLYSMSEVDILNGNFLDCSQSDVSTLNDPLSETYTCGSSDVNAAAIAWAAFIVTALSIPLAIKTFACTCEAARRLAARIDDVIRHITFLLEAVEHVDKIRRRLQESTGVISDTSNITDMFLFLQNIRKVSVAACAVIICLYLPIYGSLGVYYRQYSAPYIYAASMAYLSGIVPGSTLFVFLLPGLAAMRQAMQLFYRAKSSIKRKRVLQIKAVGLYIILLLLIAIINASVMILANVAFIYYSETSGSVATTGLTISIALFRLAWTNSFIPMILRIFIAKFISHLTLSVHSTISGSSHRQSLSNFLAETSALFVSFTSIFNNVAAPFLVVFFQSSKCFLNVIRVDGDIISSYAATYCSYIIVSKFTYDAYGGESRRSFDLSSCAQDKLYPVVSYQPPYSYTYECSSTVVASFAKVILYQCIFTTFTKPIVQLATVMLFSERRGTLAWMLRETGLLPSLVWAALESREAMTDTTNRIETSAVGAVFSSDSFISEIFSLVALLFSFGVIFPLLSVALAVSILSLTYAIQLQMGYFLHLSLKSRSTDHIQSLNVDLRYITTSFYKSASASYAFSTLLLSFFLFDISGDSAGYRAALILASVFATASGIIYCGAPVIFSNRLYRGIARSITKPNRMTGDLELSSHAIQFTENPLRESQSDARSTTANDIVL